MQNDSRPQMTLATETVENVARLARLKLSAAEVSEMTAQLTSVLQNFEKIAEVDTTGIRPLVTPTEMTINLRPDTIQEATNTDLLLENAPEKTGRLFKVPPVV